MKSEVTSTRNGNGGGDYERRNRSQRRRETYDDYNPKVVDYDYQNNGRGKNKIPKDERNNVGGARDRTRHKGYEDPKSTGMDFAGDLLEEGLELAGQAV